MRSGMMALALLLTLGLVALEPVPARAGGKVVEALKVKRGSGPGIQRSALKRAPRPSALKRVKNFFGRKLSRFKPVNRKQHAFAPAHSGDVRVFDLATSDGTTTRKGLLTQRVGEVRVEGGLLRAQVAQTWESDGHASTTHHVQDVGKKGLLMATAEKLDSPPATAIRSEGVGLPKKLKVGQTWSNTTSWEAGGALVESHSTSRVLGKVRRAGPDGKMRDGFEIETVQRSTTTMDGTAHKSTSVHRAVYLKGIGEVESSTRTDGQAGGVSRRLIGFTPGADVR
jgi:hypothetical protein